MKSIFYMLACTFTITCASAQDTVPASKFKQSRYKNELCLFAGPTYGGIRNANITADKYALARGSFGANVGFSYFIPLNRNVGYYVGFEYNTFKSTTLYRGFFRATELKKDNAGRDYYPIVDANYTETRVLTCIEIPLSLRLKTAVNKFIDLYLDAGIKLDLPVSYKLYRTGFKNTKGLYPSGVNSFVIEENIPVYGFVNTTYNRELYDIETAKVVYSLMLSPGIRARAGNRADLLFNFVYQYGVNDLNAGSANPYVNVFGEKSAYEKSTLFQYGIRAGVAFRI